MKIVRTLVISIVIILSFGLVSAYAAGSAEEASARILSGVENRENCIDLSSYGFTGSQLVNLYEETIYTNHPEYIFAAGFGYSTRNGIVQSVFPSYDASVTPERVVDYESRMIEILSTVDPALSDLEKVIMVHERLALDCDYDSTLERGESHNAICDGITVCRGYARAMVDALKRLGIEARYVSSDTMHHAWTLVKLDGHWYHIDACWDDAVYCIGSVGHRYFLKSDFAIGGHYGWADYSLLTGESLVCDDTRYDSGAFWEYLSQPIAVAVPGELYYLREGYGYSDNLRLVRRRNGEESVVCTMSVRWPEDVTIWYSNLRSGLFCYGGGIFFNDASHIYRYDIAGGQTETVYTDHRGNCLCGINMRRMRPEYYIDIELSNPGETGRRIWLTDVKTLLPAYAQ